ncbi:NACHT domain-containing protein 8 [Elsinoe australis]|uniref:NACHT domain-containing protein 8 n=1 Tax=Elsinoe australis TaxID=40998 RepID=A0A4U7APP3_9PEZI|nr:NACHT domain-containing protein 8 [Elsinoe australis]
MPAGGGAAELLGAYTAERLPQLSHLDAHLLYSHGRSTSAGPEAGSATHDNEAFIFENAQTVEYQVGSQRVASQIFNGPVHMNSSSYRPRRANTTTYESQDPVAHKRQRWMSDIYFPEYDSRRHYVAPRESKTCDWLLQISKFQDWRKVSQTSIQHDFLWIRGKPGAGKSTLMKFAWNVIATDVQPRNVLAFFFHARGQELQHNLEGMYRSLLHQLFSKRQDTQKAIDAMPEKLSSKPDERIEDLRTLFRDAFSHVGNEPLYCFVDALDECDDELAQEIVDLLGVQLKDIARDRKSVLRICLSSRHYPTVKARGGRSIILENYSGHREDMAQYIDSKLDLEDPTYRDQVRTKMLEKARGIFLWIVVVVQVINRDDEKGDLHSILKRIDDTPDDIKSLLDRIVPDVAPNESGEGDSFWLCMSWIAHARRPLSLDELYWAIVSSNPDNSWEHWSSDLVSRSIMERFVTTASRGLVEETENSPQIMEYIHETVREYFSNIDSPQGARIIANAAFMAITKGCSFYLLNAPVVTYLWKHPDASQSTPARQSHLVAERFPFLAYVVDHLFYHINLDPLSTLSNSLLDFPLLTWILPWLILSEGTMNKSRFLYGASLASVAAMQAQDEPVAHGGS